MTSDKEGADSFEREFAAVDLLVASPLHTRGGDAFALAVIKTERQVRRLLTFSVFQLPHFDGRMIEPMKDAMAKRRIFLHGLMAGFERLHPVTLASLVGPDASQLAGVLETARGYRNKIFHGQLTGDGLTRDDLLRIVEDLKEWCRLLGIGAQSYMSYQGFGDSFRKTTNEKFVVGFRRTIGDLAAYEALLDEMVLIRGPRPQGP